MNRDKYEDLPRHRMITEAQVFLSIRELSVLRVAAHRQAARQPCQPVLIFI